jgi:Ca2+-binding EF-hand superfamily protein
MVRAESAPSRPALENAKPIAVCKLQGLTPPRPTMIEAPVVLRYGGEPVDDPLANYERTSLGNWQLPAPAERGDPWLRLLLLAPPRPYVIDVAVLIDGQSFRGAREDWINAVLNETKSGATTNEATPPAKDYPKESAGTPAPDEATKAEPPTAAPAEGAAPEKRSGVKAQTRSAPTMRDRLIRYLAANGDVANRDEIDWLIAESGFGPAVVVMAPSLTWQRAGEAPLWSLLDQDADGVLSADEINGRDAKFAQTDTDANDVVALGELRRSEKPANIKFPAEGHSLVVPIDANTDWDSLAASLDRIYPSENGTSSPIAASPELMKSTADITICVNFAAKDSSAEKDNKTSGVSLLSISSELAAVNKSVTATADVISLELAGSILEVSAGQASGADSTEAIAAQVAIGAALDGYPLLRLIDRDHDDRLTLRERQELGGLLTALDRNNDKQITSSELPTPIRLAISLGPQVHQMLKEPTGAARRITPSETPKAPDWFVSMDKNNDGDLARSEFLGTAQQFRQFDADHDGLLSIPEALKVNSGL